MMMFSIKELLIAISGVGVEGEDSIACAHNHHYSVRHFPGFFSYQTMVDAHSRISCSILLFQIIVVALHDAMSHIEAIASKELVGRNVKNDNATR